MGKEQIAQRPAGRGTAQHWDGTRVHVGQAGAEWKSRPPCVHSRMNLSAWPSTFLNIIMDAQGRISIQRAAKPILPLTW